MRVSVAVSVSQPHGLFVCVRALAFEAVSVIAQFIVVYNTLLSANVQKRKQGTKETPCILQVACSERESVLRMSPQRKSKLSIIKIYQINNQYLSA